MDIQYAKELLTVLADGVNPLTGELLSKDDSCNQVEVVRALHTVIAELDKMNLKRNRTLPENAGKPWTEEEDKMLIENYRDNVSVSELAKIHKRTRGAIQSRLNRLGETQ